MNKTTSNYDIFLLALFSSLGVYFDHKLVVIPFYFLFNLLLEVKISLRKNLI